MNTEINHYKILGVANDITQKELKKAYRSLAQKHHPDKNSGDDTKFKEIKSSYELLSDPAKREEYDYILKHGHPPHTQFNFSFNGGGMDFQSMMEEAMRREAMQRQNQNRNVTVSLSISLLDAYNGIENKILSFRLNGRDSKQTIDIPPGIMNNQGICIKGEGESHNKETPPGDLIINIKVLNDPIWVRDGHNLHTMSDVSCFEAIIGSKKNIKTIDGRKLEYSLPKGTQPGQAIKLKGQGMPIRGTDKHGDIIIIVNIKIPTNLTKDQINLINEMVEHK
jgi:DnaJ-class molecular chaperone